jgi:hypothetical protein
MKERIKPIRARGARAIFDEGESHSFVPHPLAEKRGCTADEMALHMAIAEGGLTESRMKPLSIAVPTSMLGSRSGVRFAMIKSQCLIRVSFARRIR